ncbi:hypothetical protein HU200_048720 [Digitaria exilis]|uniref:Uncharacterized protein n=1 Tax=Digitaria exilis TaxID=1010633 RepID=A0A835AU23_9POAL|nr:hypothetical protein HU200_048720 [Digitaria exilis]
MAETISSAVAELASQRWSVTTQQTTAAVAEQAQARRTEVQAALARRAQEDMSSLGWSLALPLHV